MVSDRRGFDHRMGRRQRGVIWSPCRRSSSGTAFLLSLSVYLLNIYIHITIHAYAAEEGDGVLGEDLLRELRLLLDHGLVEVAVHLALERFLYG